MSSNANDTSLLTFSIGPVHSFISQARRVADLWAGSAVLSELSAAAIEALVAEGGTMIFPVVAERIPDALPNRFVARIAAAGASDIARAIERAVRSKWASMIDAALARLKPLGLGGSSQKDAAVEAIQCAWSWIPETGDYAADSRRSAEQFAASRMYRPFPTLTAEGMKCAVCGERTALPDGHRDRVTAAWKSAFEIAEQQHIGHFFRTGQGRLCLVCATKRLYPLIAGKRLAYESFPDFQPRTSLSPADPDAGQGRRARPYFSVVSMDGDHLGAALSGQSAAEGPLDVLQARLSSALTDFANSLRPSKGTDLNIRFEAKGRWPQLIYAGGEDVLFLADPRDALNAAEAVRKRYNEMLEKHGLRPDSYTISAAVLHAHVRTPAGTVFRDVALLLDEKAKKAAGRNAVAIRVDKGVDPPAEIALKWDDPLLANLSTMTGDIAKHAFSSRQTYLLAEEGRPLIGILAEGDWEPWLTSRLSSAAVRDAAQAASLIAPFFRARKVDALRVARFVAIETR